MSDQKANKRTDYFEVYGVLGTVNCLFTAPIYYCYLFYYYLKYGFLPELSALVLDLLHSFKVVEVGDWLVNPSSWIGLHKIIMIFFSILGPGLYLVPFGLFLWFISRLINTHTDFYKSK